MNKHIKHLYLFLLYVISFCLNIIISFCLNIICSVGDLNQKKHFIIRNTPYLTDEDRADVGRIISREGQILLLKQGSDGGSRINLDLLDERIINQIYSLVEYKINKLKG